MKYVVGAISIVLLSAIVAVAAQYYALMYSLQAIYDELAHQNATTLATVKDFKADTESKFRVLDTNMQLTRTSYANQSQTTQAAVDSVKSGLEAQRKLVVQVRDNQIQIANLISDTNETLGSDLLDVKHAVNNPPKPSEIERAKDYYQAIYDVCRVVSDGERPDSSVYCNNMANQMFKDGFRERSKGVFVLELGERG